MGTYDPVSALGGNQTLMARCQLIHVLNHLYKGVQRFAFYELQDEFSGGEDLGFLGRERRPPPHGRRHAQLPHGAGRG